MTGRRRLAALALAAAVAGGCGAPEGEGGPAPDSTLVSVLIEMHLADARAALDTTAGPALADSLRAVALAAHDLDSTALADQLDALADDPDQARAVYDTLDTRLSLERQGVADE